MEKFSNYFKFRDRHIGPDAQEIKDMLQTIGVDSMEQLIDEVIPQGIRMEKGLKLPEAQSEREFLEDFKKLASKNKVFKSYIGFGYYNTVTPTVIKRNILENPGWYTAYTPYQAEIAQGRLEMLANFQTMVMDLTGMEIANASLLDEATAAAEAMSMFYGMRKGSKKQATAFLVDQHVFPQTLDLLRTRANPMGIEIIQKEIEVSDFSSDNIFGVYFQYPNARGQVYNPESWVRAAAEHQVYTAVGSDLLVLTLLTPPGDWGVDVLVGSAQRLGVPMGFGGPHAAFFATREKYKRQVPGRMIGVSVDQQGNKAYRMALQTREQHIKRERATSNICTAQVLLAVISAAYAIYHGSEGLKQIALNTHRKARYLADQLKAMGLQVTYDQFFDTLHVQMDEEDKARLKALAADHHINFNYFEKGALQLSVDEAVTRKDVLEICDLFASFLSKSHQEQELAETLNWEDALIRKSEFMTHAVFNTYHSEHEMLRYLKKLENKDLSLVHSMISLGSCTMKLNATSEMEPITWPEFASLHPFAPEDQTEGYLEMHQNLSEWLCEITGFAGMSLQPNSGAQGEYAGLLTIREYLHARGEGHRNVAIIPVSAHGTNPASAVMAGMEVILVGADDHGNIDLNDLREKAEANKDRLAALMVTYPSTHGVFEEEIREICDIIHQYGGQVYMDGANMNAQVGLTSPALIGADVCHLNLHKTFCIPHGGGGPGMGPIGVAEHLVPFLPGHSLIKTVHNGNNRVSAAPYGSASILPISYAYIRMMGGDGLTNATEVAILNANYIKARLEKHYPILYSNKKGRNAHEFILDCRDFKSAGIEAEDIAKRLMDYGFHSPTLSFPVAGTFMIEPTESETKGELDRFCDAMIAIREEIREIENGIYNQEDNVLKNAPHTMEVALATEWNHSYSREKATMPLPYVRESKFWPSVSRIDSAYGDRNLYCACIPTEEYQQQEQEMVN